MCVHPKKEKEEKKRLLYTMSRVSLFLSLSIRLRRVGEKREKEKKEEERRLNAITRYTSGIGTERENGSSWEGRDRRRVSIVVVVV